MPLGMMVIFSGGVWKWSTHFKVWACVSTNEKVLRVPSRTEPFGGIGWTVYEFATAREAAEFVRGFPQAAMPCWKRFEIIGGELIQVR